MLRGERPLCRKHRQALVAALLVLMIAGLAVGPAVKAETASYALTKTQEGLIFAEIFNGTADWTATGGSTSGYDTSKYRSPPGSFNLNSGYKAYSNYNVSVEAGELVVFYINPIWADKTGNAFWIDLDGDGAQDAEEGISFTTGTAGAWNGHWFTLGVSGSGKLYLKASSDTGIHIDDIYIMRDELIKIQSVPNGYVVAFYADGAQAFNVTSDGSEITVNVTDYIGKLPFEEIKVFDSYGTELTSYVGEIYGGDIFRFAQTVPTTLTLETDDLLYASGDIIKASGRLTDDAGSGLAGCPVKVTLGDVSKTVNTNSTGYYEAELTAPTVAVAKTFEVTAEFAGVVEGSTEYLNSSASKTIVVYAYSEASEGDNESSGWLDISAIVALLEDFSAPDWLSELTVIPSLIFGFIGAFIGAILRKTWKWILTVFFIFLIAGFAAFVVLFFFL